MPELSWSEHVVSENPVSPVRCADPQNAWLDLALQSAQMSAYKWDLQTNLLTRAHQEQSDSWVYDEALEWIYSDDRERVVEIIEDAIKSKKKFNMEFRVKLPDAPLRWLQAKGHTIYGDHEVPLYVLAVIQEVTARKETELQLLNKNRELEMQRGQLKMALDGAGMALLTDINAFSKFVSPELSKILGFENKDTVFDLELVISRIHPEDRERVIANMQKSSRDGGPISDEHRIILPNGEIRWLMIKGVTIMGDNGGRDFLIIQDMTAQKNAQELLAQKERHLSVISNRMPQLVWIADSAGALTWVNDRIVEYSGVPASDLLGWGYLKLHSPEFLDKTLSKIKKHLEIGLPWEDTFPLLSHDKQWRWFLSRAEPIRDSQQKIVSWVGTNTDVTEEREVTKNLENQKIVREEFSFTLTHDLRNPLGVISMCVHLARLERSNPEKFERHLQKAQETIQRMDKMIGELLTANLIGAGQQIQFEMGFFDIQRLIHQIVDEFSLRFQSKILFHYEGECWGYWNEDGMRRVFENLLANAVKYGDPAANITVSLQRSADELTVEVHNYGRAIPAHELAHIFEMHCRAGRRDDRGPSGWGIGLTLVRGIVHAHKGALTVTSDELKGTTFRFCLPVDTREKT